MPASTDPQSLGLLMEANLFAFHADLGRSPLVELYQGLDVSWYRSGLPFHRLNRVLGGCFLPQQADARVEDITSLFAQRGLPAVWHLGPSRQPADLGERLKAHGWELSSEEPGMALDLSRLPPEGALPPGLFIQAVADGAALREWCLLASASFGDSPAGAEAAWQVEASLGLSTGSPRRYFTGRLEGQVVGTAALFIGSGVAGLYNVSVHPEYRRRGIARALTLAALHAACREGWPVATLHASAMGRGLYLQLGFQPVCTLERYRYTPA